MSGMIYDEDMCELQGNSKWLWKDLARKGFWSSTGSLIITKLPPSPAGAHLIVKHDIESIEPSQEIHSPLPSLCFVLISPLIHNATCTTLAGPDAPADSDPIPLACWGSPQFGRDARSPPCASEVPRQYYLQQCQAVRQLLQYNDCIVLQSQRAKGNLQCRLVPAEVKQWKRDLYGRIQPPILIDPMGTHSSIMKILTSGKA